VIVSCLEHITVVEGNVLAGIQRAFEAAPEPERRTEVHGTRKRTVDSRARAREQRVEDPLEVMPQNRWPSFEELGLNRPRSAA
jgi:hypothetical protein